MKKPTIFKTLIAVVFLLLSFSSHAQLRKGFTTRYTTSLNGDILVIGNNSLNRDTGKNGGRPLDNYDDQGSTSKVNDNFDMKYIDVDSETSFNSSYATLKIPDASKSCFEIVYAALYWSGTYQGTDRSKINQVRLKTPTATTYKDLTGSVLWDEGGTGVATPYGSLPYACFVDITDDVKAAKEGIYTVADVMCSEGKFSPGGNSAGWSIFVIYKDPLLPSKYITSFDGFSIIRSSDPPLDIPISGFRTNPFGNVNVKLAFSALEGDNQLEGDGLQIIGGKPSSVWGAISSLARPITPAIPAGGPIWNPTPAVPAKPNFFNSTITDGDVIMGGRKPSSKNTLGFDAGVVTLDNNVGGVQNSVMQNDETSATLRINTSQDSYFMFFNAMSVEIIAPKIVLKKNVLSDKDVNIGSQPVTLNQELRYEIKFKNEGNDDAKNFTITDVIPDNVIFNGVSDILVMDPRITATYTAATRTLVFSIPDALVIAKGAEFTLKFKVKVVDDCNELIDACSNEIKNTAVSKYYGVKNTTPEGFGEGSYSTISSCNVGEPTSTNFLVGIKDCLFSRNVSLCGTVVLTAANGYSTYVWRDPNGVIFGGNNRQVTIDKPGTYTVNNSGAANCEDIQQTFIVTDYLASANKNPIKGDNIDPATGVAYGCVRDNKPFPKIFLCGLNDKRFIDTQITGATSITWQETKDVTPSTNPDSCPYEGATNWTTVANGPTFTADRAGVFRLVVNYGNNTCVVTHYFNVYQNLLDATAKKQDIVCNTKGSITVTNPLPNTGYVYSLDGTNYQASNIFNNVAKGSYTVSIKQTVLEVGQVFPCIFKVDVNVEQLDFTTKLDATHPLCNGEHGTITATINNVPGQYQFILRKKGSTVEIQNSGLINNNIITFNGVDPGVYEVLMSTANNGCSVIKEIEVFDYRLTAVANITKALTACSNGEITVSVTGGTPRPGPPPYYLYYVNGNTNFVTDPKIPVTASGDYNIVVVDANGCTVKIPTIKVTDLPKPKVTFKADDVNCYGGNSGVINVDITPADSGYAVSYSVNGGAFSSVAPITNLTPDTYSIVVKYTYNGVECLDPAVNVTIKGPDAALSASAGVSELAGCGPTGSEFQGKVRITNPQGGTPGYTYSFDDQKTWSPINEAFVDPGTYTLYIKDSKGCIFAMSGVVLDGKPADPTIALDPTVYNCDGTGKTTATVTNSGGKNYSYEYYIDGKPNTPLTNNIFNNVLTGPHTISVKYKLLDAATYSNLLHEDFGKDTFTYTDTASPDGSSPGINPAFCWERQIEATKCNGNRLFANGEYTVTSSLRNDPYSGWQNPIDHTSGSRTGGRYLAVDAGTAIPNNAVLYRKTIKDIIPGQPIQVRFFATNLLKIGNTQPDASLTVELQNAAGTPLSSQSTGKIPKTNGWVEYNRSIDPGSNTTLDFVLRLEISQVNGIDFAVDDIEVYQLPKSCITEKKFDFNIDSNKAFTVLEPAIESVDCSGGNTGKITITAQNFNGSFLYSIDGGSNWTTSTTSPVIIDKLVAKSYSVIVKSDAAGTCSKSFTKVITENQPVTVTASVTTLPTCTSGATITAEAKGGVGPYTYALKLADGVTDVAGYGFPHSATFAGVSNGTYTVVAHDSKGCTSAVSTVVIVDKPAPPVASLDATSDLCYDTTNKATLVVTATGTGILNYSLDGGAFDTNNTFTNVGVGTHNIVVRDGNNCTTPINGIIINGELTAKGNVTKTLDCNTVGATIKVDINGGKAPFTYKYKLGVGGTYSASVNVTGNTFNYAAPGTGTYYFEITDSNTPKACVTTTSVTVDAITKPIASAAPTNVTCFGGSTGEVTLGASGGSGSGYSYSFNGSGFTSTIKYTSLKAGIPYKYQVKDDKGCISDEGSITLTEPGAVTGSIKATDIQCGTTGTVAAIVTLTAGGGTAPYKYSFTGPSNYGDGNTYSTTVSGVVKGYIIDKNGCQLGPLSITIDALDQITDITITDNGYDCSTTPPGGHVNIAAVKGGVSAPIRYQIISGPAGYNSAVNSDGEFKSLTPGDYIFQATDIKTGCTFQKPYTVKGAPDIVAGGSVLTAIKCFGGTGTIQFTVNGVKGKYDYVITDSALNSIQNGNNIAGTNTTITVSSALAAGDYTITATDRTTKCQAIYVVKLTQPTIGVSVTATASNITCSKFTSTITAVGLGGTPAYKYAVVKQTALDPAVTDYDPSATLSVNTNNGLDVNWVVFVMDANGCTAKYPVKIDKDPTPTVTAKVDNQCTGSGNSFTITATGTPGTGTLTYGINGVNGAFSTNNVFNVGPGTYTVWVKDGNLCPASAPAVTVYDQLTAGTVIKELDCSLTPNATITVTPSGGLAPYKYEVSTNGGTSYSAMASNVYSTAVAGTFKIKVTDANLCTVIVTETILSISNPTASIVTQSNVSCNGKLDGSVTIKGTGGSGGFTYSKAATSGFGPSASFTGLGAGSYTFYVKDSKGCVGSVPVTITEPKTLVISSIVTPFACSTTNTKVQGKVVIDLPATGTSPYQYSFNSGGYSATNTLLVDDNGTNQKVDYSVKDANGCIATGSVTLLKLNPPVIDKITPSAITCLAGATTSTVTVDLVAGTGVVALKYETIAPSQAIIAQQSSNSFTGLAAGSYTFKVTDANGCFDTKVITINTAVKIAVSGNKNNDVKCKGGSTGNGTFTISNVATPGDYTFVLTAGTLGTGSLTKSATDANVLVLKDVAVGTYTVEVTSISTGCKNTATITIGEPLNPLTANLVQVNGNCKVGTSAVTINAAGGTLAYKYAFVLDGAAMGTLTTSNTANLDPALGSDWDGYVVDANGCQVKFDIKIVNDAVPTVTATATNQCLGVGTYTITASALGKGPFTYSINGTSFDTPNTFTVTTAGTYNIWAKDANGCIAKTTTPVTVYDKLTITPIVDKDITCTVGLEAAKATLTIGGGSGSYSYSYTATPSTAVGTFAGNVFTTSDAADYIFTVKDDVTNCTATIAVPVSITTPTPPHFTIPLPAVISCFGDTSGSLTINIDPTQGVAPFVIKVKNKATGQDYGTQTSGLPAAIYVVTVTDAKGCFYAEDVEIKEATEIKVVSHADPITCDALSGGISKGNVVVDSVVGGTAPYTYYVTGLNGYDKFEPNNTGATSVTFNVVDFGYYTIRVVDANGCSVIEKDVLVASPPDNLDIAIDLTTVNCEAIVGPPAVPAGGTAVVTIGTKLTGKGPFHFNIYTGVGQVFTGDGNDGWIPEFPSVGSESATFYGLTPGVTYTFIVYDEVTKCYYYQQANDAVPSKSTLSIVNDVVQNITCTGAGNGKVTFEVKNNYTSSSVDVSYQVYESFSNLPIAGASGSATIAGGATSPSVDLGPLPVGTYYVLVKEVAGPNKGCSVVSKDFNIKESPKLLNLSASATSIADCNNLGTISAQAKDGTAPYTYQVVASGASPVDADWKTPNTFTRPGSVAGIVYDVYTKDAFGCIQHVPVTVYKYEAPKINLPAPICYDGNQFTISITGFVDPAIVGGATYSVDGSAFQVSPNFKFNGAKVYKLYIKDGKGCTDTVDYEVKPQLKLDVDLTKDIDCSGTPDAKITLTASGGFGPTYKFEYSTNNGGSWTTMPGNVLDTSVTGNYIFKATDNGNTTACSVEKGFTLDPIPTIAFTVDPKDVTCFGDSNGTITVNVTSGTGPYEYQLEQGATILVPFQGSSQFKNLLAGNNYVVRVKDAKQCTDNHTATVGTPALALSASSSITAPLNCTTGNAATKAIVTVKGIDGTSPYQYSYDGGLTYTTNDKYETYAGIKFDVYVMDANGCKFLLKDGIDVPKLNAPTDMDISGTLVFCQPVGRQTSTVTIDKVYNGVGTPQYEILSPIVKVKQPSNVFAGLAPSNDPYVFQVTDANGCTYQESYIVKPAVNITVSGTVVSDVTCNPGSNGEVLFTVGNFTGTYSYVLNAGAPVTGQTSKTISITGLTAASTQSIVVTDEVTGCIAPASVNVIQNPALSLSLLANVPANCDNKAKVQVKAAGGVAPYEYSFVAATATGPGTYTTSDTAFLDATVPNWKVYVKDANGCEITAPFAVTITKDAAPVIAMPASICYVGSNVIIDLNALSTVAVGPAKYTLNGVEIPGTTYTVTGAGTYIFGIIDGNGCKSNQVSFVVKPQVFLQADLNQDLTCAVDATIKLTPRGGTGTYNLYEVDINGTGYNAFTTLPYVATVDGTYTFRVTDSQGCPAVSNAVIVTPKTVPKGIAVATKVSCFGDSNGSIVVTASNGIEPYKYRIVGGIFQDSNIFKGLTAGSYNIEVKDAKECISVLIPVTVGAPAALSASSLITTKLECSTGNAPTKAEVTITGIGGTTPYQFSYDGGLTYSTDNTYETYAGIKFDVYVMDNNGCKFLLKDGVDVPKLNAPTDMDITGTLVFCQPAGRQTSTVTISNVKNGVGTPQFEILSPIVKVKQTSNVFAGLAPNNAPYVFQVTDANGCTYQESYIVKPAVVITVSAGSTTDASCNGGANGSAKFNVDNFTGTYSAALIAGTGTVTIAGKVVTVTGLVAGTYTLEVTDDVTGCKNTATIKIGEPAVLDVKLISQTAANCYSGAIVKVQGIGGTPVYKYAFVVSGATPGPLDYTTEDTTVLDFAKGPNWDVYVQDGNLICSNKLAITITKDDAPTIDVITDKYCYTGGPVPIKINGKTDPDIVDPPMYSIGNGYYLSPNFTLNAPGTYDFYIKDGNGCIAHAKYTLKQELLLQATLVQDLNCTTNDATITLLATQGTGTYPTFQVSKDGAPYTTVTSPYKPTAAGTYTFKVNDGQCDAVSVPVIITPITTSKFTTTQVNVRCKGDSNGSITVTASNGVAPYEYSIDGAAFGSLNVFSGLKAGTYSIVVRDAKKCPSLPVDVTITEPETLKVSNAVTPFTCSTTNTAQDAFITLTATDGTTPYSYSFDNGQTFGTSPVHIMNAAGTINYVVVDFNGCRVSGSAIVVPYTPPTKFVIAATPIYCKTAGGFTTISVDPVTIVGGVAPYKYAIISPAASVTAPSTVNTFAGLLPNTYVIEVTDANGCSTTNSIIVKKASEISVDAQLLNDVLCNGGSTGSIAFTVSNYITANNYDFGLNPNNGTFTQTGDVITYTGLTAGKYTFTVTDRTSGCTDSVVDFEIKQPSAALAFTTVATNISCNNKNATITVTVTGGTPSYGYAAVVAGKPAPTTFSADNKIVVDTNNGADMVWDVYVKDLNGCSPVAQQQTILVDPLPSAITASVTSQCASPAGTYEFIVSATGVAPLQYSIGGDFQTDPKFVVTVAGSYDITVKDANGCTTTVNAAVVIEDALDLQVETKALPSCDFQDGIVIAKATGGSGSYKYTSGAYIPVVVGTTATFNNMPAGTHTILVRDLVYGCTDTVIVELKKATEITGLSLTGNDVSCNGGSDGLIIVNLDPTKDGVNDNPVYTYTLTGTTISGTPVSKGPQESNVFDNLQAGDYTVLVTSGRGCHAQVDKRIKEPKAIVVDAPVVTSFNCTTGTNAVNFATITVNSVNGGSGKYVRYEFSKNGTVVQNTDSNVYTEYNLAGGSYTVRVFDDKGCEGSWTTPIIIDSFITMDKVNVAIVKPITCLANETIQVSVTTTGGTPALLSYTLTGVNGTVFSETNSTGLFKDLAIGNYKITVFNATTGCTITDFHYVFDPNTFAINVEPLKGKLCYGDADGSVNLTFVDNQLVPTNDAGPFSYVITGPVPSNGTTTSAGPILVSGLKAGVYTVTATLTDINGPSCTVTNTFTIDQAAAPLAVTKTQSEITCLAGNKDGIITASATGGWPGDYLYELRLGTTIVKGYSTSPVFENLTAGDYTVYVKDGLGCEAFVDAKLTNPKPIDIQISATPMLTCFDNEDGVVTVDVITGGSGNYTYTLNGVLADGTVVVVESQGTKQFIGLKAGTYTVTAKDTWGCENISNKVVIDQPTKVKAELTIARNETCQLVPILKITATGGKAPYYYSADGTNYSASFNSTIDITLPKTTVNTEYKYFVKDSNDCISTISNTVEVPTVPKLDFTSLVDVDIKCKGSAEGTITAIATGGLGNYVYTLQDAAGVDITPAPTQLTPGVFTGLAVGNYRVKLESSDCSVTSAPIEISQPNVELSAEAIPTNVTCNGFNNGKITVNAAGGTGVYKYAIEPEFRQFFDKNVFENLKPGFYDVLVQDENECYIFIKDVEVKEPAPLTGALVDGTLFPETCAGEKDGSFSVILSGGTLDYSVSLDSETGPFTQGTPGQTTFDFDNLSGGPHIVYFVDASGCNNQVDIAMDYAVTLNPTNEVSYDCVNNAASNMVTVDPGYDGDHSEIDYSLDGGPWQMNNIYTGLTPGDHTIKVRHTNGCTADTSFNIKVVNPLLLTLSEEKGVWNVITATATGGSGDYEYSIDGINFSSENKFTIYRTDTYTITVRDKNGCTHAESIPVKYVDVCLPNYFTPDGTYYTGWGPGCTNIYTNLIFSIFDRYGREIAKYHYGQKWDGRYNGEELPSGDYWYVLKLNDEKDAREFVGHFTLYR